jgi:hypothetical protein
VNKSKHCEKSETESILTKARWMEEIIIAQSVCSESHSSEKTKQRERKRILRMLEKSSKRNSQ